MKAALTALCLHTDARALNITSAPADGRDQAAADEADEPAAPAANGIHPLCRATPRLRGSLRGWDGAPLAVKHEASIILQQFLRIA